MILILDANLFGLQQLLIPQCDKESCHAEASDQLVPRAKPKSSASLLGKVSNHCICLCMACIDSE